MATATRLRVEGFGRTMVVTLRRPMTIGELYHVFRERLWRPVTIRMGFGFTATVTVWPSY